MDNVENVLVYVGYMVCYVGFDPQEVLAVISPSQAQLPFRYVLQKMAKGEISVERLCKCYEQYLQCFAGSAPLIGGLKAYSNCSALYYMCVVGGRGK
jgi:hypothetical protein